MFAGPRGRLFVPLQSVTDWLDLLIGLCEVLHSPSPRFSNPNQDPIERRNSEQWTSIQEAVCDPQNALGICRFNNEVGPPLKYPEIHYDII